MLHNEKIDMRVKYTREWTFEALSKLLEHTPYNQIKISEIIAKAGISRATFYRNFKNKDDIVIIKVRMMFQEFHQDLVDAFDDPATTDEIYLIQAFFKKIDEEEKVIDTVIKTNLEYTMVEGIVQIIEYYKERFYQLLKTNKKTEDYIIDIMASSTWTLLSRWHRSGKEESATQLVRIYLSAFRSVYIALFEDRSLL
ncbi:TetR/AcrR family transcriptional regulator [Candidatus Xianfuyuplasma coldseepsis]|uniref:TetR/AcrR family transcriptional regulator n=1 Tax=Candidatus Xianfuyuplasma coldseepsis TaxID=2782163 RepID=A0A7L7KRC8_9MOLU|nr:TetR/AcrR family transcriptional regulator [Xianfuyuplasma coldseepsis]QMS84358.1 TetR/AcrR family transcriptional regulator [Xianfuyuplasma coldseepsis]